MIGYIYVFLLGGYIIPAVIYFPSFYTAERKYDESLHSIVVVGWAAIDALAWPIFPMDFEIK